MVLPTHQTPLICKDTTIKENFVKIVDGLRYNYAKVSPSLSGGRGSRWQSVDLNLVGLSFNVVKPRIDAPDHLVQIDDYIDYSILVESLVS